MADRRTPLPTVDFNSEGVNAKIDALAASQGGEPAPTPAPQPDPAPATPPPAAADNPPPQPPSVPDPAPAPQPAAEQTPPPAEDAPMTDEQLDAAINAMEELGQAAGNKQTMAEAKKLRAELARRRVNENDLVGPLKDMSELDRSRFLEFAGYVSTGDSAKAMEWLINNLAQVDQHRMRVAQASGQATPALQELLESVGLVKPGPQVAVEQQEQQPPPAEEPPAVDITDPAAVQAWLNEQLEARVSGMFEERDKAAKDEAAQKARLATLRAQAEKEMTDLGYDTTWDEARGMYADARTDMLVSRVSRGARTGNVKQDFAKAHEELKGIFRDQPGNTAPTGQEPVTQQPPPAGEQQQQVPDKRAPIEKGHEAALARAARIFGD